MDFKKRRKAYMNRVGSSLSVFFSGEDIVKSADESYPFCVNRNFYYLTGIDKKSFALIIFSDGIEEKEFLFIEKQDQNLVLWVEPKMSKKEAKRISNIENIYYIEELDNIISLFLQNSRKAIAGKIDSIYFDLERMDINKYPSISNQYANKLIAAYPNLLIKDSFAILSTMRCKKSKEEIKEIKEAIKITKEGIYNVMLNAKPNMYEYQAEAFFSHKIKYFNKIESFKSIIAGGQNATVLHYSNNDCKINEGTLLLLDVGCFNNNYSSDISRTFPINKKFSKRQKEIYNIVLKANKETIAFLSPGITWEEFNEFGKNIMITECKKIGLIKEDAEIEKYYYHSLGHSLGLDVHDVGRQEGIIEEGTVLTVEPGLYIEEEQIGIRIEDDVYITCNGAINLSENIIKEIDEIEDLMRKG